MRPVRARALQFCASTRGILPFLINGWILHFNNGDTIHVLHSSDLVGCAQEVWKAVENVNRPQVRPFEAAPSQMWGSEKLLKLAQAKHRICHTHGNDIKLVCDGAPGFPEMRDSSPTLRPGGGCSGWLPFHQRSLEARILCAARGTVNSCFLFPPRAGQEEIKWIKQYRQDLA